MKELVLSVLSRGHSHVVYTDDTRQYGRLEVCFEPEDYFIWRSQLCLSSSGQLLSAVDHTLPKTFSTRRGPLILFSERFASSSSQTVKVSRKQRIFRASREETEFKFYSLQHLSEATIVCCKKQAKVECQTSIQSMFPSPKSGSKYLQSHQRPGDECSYLTQTTGEENKVEYLSFKRQANRVYPRPEQVRPQPRFLCLPRLNRPSPGALPLLTLSPALRHSRDRPHMPGGKPATFKPTEAEERSITKDRKTSFRTEMTPKAQTSPIPESDVWKKHTEEPQDHSVCMVKGGLKAGSLTQESRKEAVLQLPDIHQPAVRAEAVAPKPSERTLLKKVLVLLPLAMDQEHKTTVGPLPPFVGRRGLGKQCSMAFYRQDPHNQEDQSEPEPAVIRGSLPLQLRECQKDGLLGTLIMGPTGEIICLSFWDPLTCTEDHPPLKDGMREHVVRVMTSEGVLEESWKILDQLDEQATQTGSLNDEQDVKRGLKRQSSIKQETCIPEQTLKTTNSCTENQFNNKVEDNWLQIEERTQKPQPKAGGKPGSPPRPVSASSTQKTALSAPTALDEHIDKTKHQSQTESLKNTVKSRESGNIDNTDNPIRNVKNQKFYQHANNAEKTSETDNVDTEAENTRFGEPTTSGAVQKRNKHAGVEKAKSNQSQNGAEKVNKKSKGQAAFVVGKPRQSQDVVPAEKTKYTSGKCEKTESKVLKASKDKLADYYDSSEHIMEDMERSQASTPPENPEDECSLNTDQDFGSHERCVDGHGMENDNRAAVFTDIDGTRDSEWVSDFHEHNVSAVSSRSSSASIWSVRRVSESSDTGMCSPVQPSTAHLLPCNSVSTQNPASNPGNSESATDASEETTNLRKSRTAAALAEKEGRRQLEVDRKREKEDEQEQRKRQKEKEHIEERMRLELEEEKKERAEQARLRQLKEEEERQAEKKKEQRREQAELARERRRKEETRNRKRYLERLQKERHEGEMKAAELKRQHEEEKWRLQKISETERLEYMRRRWDEEDRRNTEKERIQTDEKTAMGDEEYNKQRAALEQTLELNRRLFIEREGLKQKQSISRPWVFSYFRRLGLADFNPS